MTHNFRESFTNTRRADNPEFLADKLLGPSCIASHHNYSSPEATYPIGKSSPSIDCHYHQLTPEENLARDKSVPKYLIKEDSQVNLSYSDQNETPSIENTSLRYSILPLFGLKEQATQTIMTSRDIEDLEEIKKNWSSSRSEYLKELFKGTSNIFRKVLDTADFQRSLPFEQPLMRNESLEFLSLKRENDNKIPNFCNKMKSLPKSELNTGVQQRPSPMKRRKRNRSNLTPKRSQKILVNSKPIEEMTVLDMIHDIKNPCKMNVKNNEIPHEKVSDIHRTKSLLSTSLNTNSKIQPEMSNGKRKFDAYHFFKAEYMTSNSHKPEDELERDCKREWNNLEKEVKKLYNMNAERERKNHKLKKKIAKEQSKQSLNGTR